MHSIRRSARRLSIVATSVALLAGVTAGTGVAATETVMVAPDASIDPWLVGELSGADPDDSLVVLVHGVDLIAAKLAVTKAGMSPIYDFRSIGVVAASGTADQIGLAARQPGVTYLEGNQPLEYHLDTSHEATRGALAMTALADADGAALDGTGVSVAVIDTGVDPTHPFFAEPDGSSAVVANLKNACSTGVSINPSPIPTNTCFVDVGPLVDTDSTAAGGHGTHVNGIVAGRPTELDDGSRVHGAAPGATLVSLAVGATVAILNADMALDWVLQNHDAPCGSGVPASDCPPIKVTNNSYGPPRGAEFNPNSATTKLQQQMVDAGIVTVWANGNAAGDGSSNASNPPAQDPTPGIIGVANYSDQGTGTREGTLAGSSSRGDRNRPSTWPDISAPGTAITSSCRPYLAVCTSTNQDNARNGPAETDIRTFNSISGTSMAAPHIAGIVAQLFQAEPSATPADVEHALKSTAYKFSFGPGYESVDGYTSSYDKGTGLVDVVAAVRALQGNRVVNGSFETSSDGLRPNGWTGGIGTGYDTDGLRSSDGNAAVSITGQGTLGAGTWSSTLVTVQAGKTYGLAATVTSASGTAAPVVRVEFFDDASQRMGVTTVDVPSPGELLGTVTAPAGATRARVVLAGFADPAPTGTVWFDDVWLG